MFPAGGLGAAKVPEATNRLCVVRWTPNAREAKPRAVLLALLLPVCGENDEATELFDAAIASGDASGSPPTADDAAMASEFRAAARFDSTATKR